MLLLMIVLLLLQHLLLVAHVRGWGLVAEVGGDCVDARPPRDNGRAGIGVGEGGEGGVLEPTVPAAAAAVRPIETAAAD